MLVKLEARIKQGLLCRFREARKLTQAEAADMAGVALGVWGAIECMRFKDASWEAIRKVATLLEVETDAVCPPEIKEATLRIKHEAYRDERVLESYARGTRERLSLPMFDADGGAPPDIKDALSSVMKSLTFRERTILQLRYGLGKDGVAYTYENIGRIMRVTKERVRQVEAKAIRKLQHPVRADKLAGDLGWKV